MKMLVRLNNILQIINFFSYQMAQSDLSVLMMEDLTDGETSFDSIKTAVDSGIKEASIKVEDAAQEVEMKIARFF